MRNNELMIELDVSTYVTLFNLQDSGGFSSFRFMCARVKTLPIYKSNRLRLGVSYVVSTRDLCGRGC